MTTNILSCSSVIAMVDKQFSSSNSSKEEPLNLNIIRGLEITGEVFPHLTEQKEENHLKDTIKLLVNHDLKRRKQRQALQETASRFYGAFHSAAIGMAIISLEGNWLVVNPFLCQMVGYSETELQQTNFQAITHPDDLHKDLTDLDMLLVQEIDHYQTEKRYIHKQGEQVWVNLSISLVRDKFNQPLHFIKLIENISQRKQAEAEIKQAKQKLRQANLNLEKRVEERTTELLKAKEVAETANKAKDHFLAHISHELRTPLNSILGFTQILQKDVSLNQNHRQNIQLVHQSGQHLLTLINDILDFSKITAEKLVLEPKTFAFSSCLDDLVNLIRIRTQHNNLSFNYQLLAGLPTLVNGDETRLKQVLLNLLGNAIKFTSEGSVGLRVGYVKDFINEDKPNPELITTDKIRFEIEDTGIGIPLDKLEDIFLPFEQVSNDLANKQGTGLGLAISNNIIQLMDSKIQVKSSLGKGSIFWFDLDLPKVESDIVCLPISSISTPVGFQGKARKILIVDDVPTNIQLLSGWLKPIGFEIAEANNGEEGLAIARSFQPDVMLVDLMMPVMNGIEMATRVRKDLQLKETIIFAVSANVRFSDCLKYDRELFNTFVSKPIDLSQLLNLLGSSLQLEWIMEEIALNDMNSEQEALVIPPREIIEELLNLAKIGDIKQIIAKNTLLEQSESKYSLFIAKINQLAANYEQNNLLKLLENATIQH